MKCTLVHLVARVVYKALKHLHVVEDLRCELSCGVGKRLHDRASERSGFLGLAWAGESEIFDVFVGRCLATESRDELASGFVEVLVGHVSDVLFACERHDALLLVVNSVKIEAKFQLAEFDWLGLFTAENSLHARCPNVPRGSS